MKLIRWITLRYLYYLKREYHFQLMSISTNADVIPNVEEVYNGQRDKFIKINEVIKIIKEEE